MKRERAAGLHGDAGSGSIWVACMMLALATFAMGLTAAAAVASQSAQAAAAADLAALAAADALQHWASAEVACATAARVAELNRSTMLTCSLSGADVSVAVVTRGAGAGRVHGRARSRAGPATR